MTKAVDNSNTSSKVKVAVRVRPFNKRGTFNLHKLYLICFI